MLLALGADPTCRGSGRFRLCGTRQTLAGKHTPLEWTRLLLEREQAIGVDNASLKTLRDCEALLIEAERARIGFGTVNLQLE